MVFFVVLIFCLGADVMVFIIDGHTCPVRWLIKRGNTQTSFRHHNSVVIWSQGTISGSVRGLADSDVGGCGWLSEEKTNRIRCCQWERPAHSWMAFTFLDCEWKDLVSVLLLYNTNDKLCAGTFINKIGSQSNRSLLHNFNYS